MAVPSLPFRILALTPVVPQQKVAWARPAVSVKRGELDQAIAACGLSFPVSVPADIRRDGWLPVEIRRFKDFHPDGLSAAQPDLAVLVDARDFVRDAAARGISMEAVHERLRGIPDLPVTIQAPPPARTSPGKSVIDDILSKVAMPEGTPGAATETRTIITQIEAVLQAILRNIFSNKDFRGVESAWRGVQTLLHQGIGDGDIELELVPVTMETLEETLGRLTLTCADNLPSLVLIDLPFDKTPYRVELLEKVMIFAETLLAPTVCCGSPGVLGLGNWEELSRLPYLPNVLDEPEFGKWRRLQGLPAARWVAVACNPFLARLPYGPDNKPLKVRFDEPEWLFASPVWAVGALIAQSVRKQGWPTRFTEWPKNRLENLPLRDYERGHKIPTETTIGDDRLKQFAKAGFTPLASALDKDTAFTPVESTLSRGSLRYQLLLSRVAGLLLWCRENLSADLAGAGIEEGVRQAFDAFWEKTGHPAPAGLRVTATPGTGGKAGALRVVIDPSREVLPTGERIELEIPW